MGLTPPVSEASNQKPMKGMEAGEPVPEGQVICYRPKKSINQEKKWEDAGRDLITASGPAAECSAAQPTDEQTSQPMARSQRWN
jgi:hypothetical protein